MIEKCEHETVIVQSMVKKSQLLQFVLALLLGPLGLFYSSVAAALFWLLAVFGVGSVTFVLGALLLWPFIILTGFYTVNRHNRAVRLEQRRHEELLEVSSRSTKG